MGMMSAHPFHLLRLNLLLAATCILSGAFSLLLALPPGYIAPLFPPAGIALAAALVYGWRASPGVLLGSLCIQILAHWHAQAPQLNPLLLCLATLGAFLQAYLGAWIFRQLLIWPGGLDSVRHTVCFIALGAPLTCLVSASLATPFLSASGLTGWRELAENWAVWWAGDTMGVLLFTPITLAFIGPASAGWLGRKRNVAAPLLLCALLIGGALDLVRQREHSRIAEEFQRNAEHFANTLAARLSAQMDMLMSIERFSSINQNFSRQDWEQITALWLARYPGTTNLTWNPFVLHADKARFEDQQRRNGLKDFHIKGRDNTGHFIPVKDAPAYFPILYVEPLHENQQVLGLNSKSFSVSARAIALSQATGRPAATEAVRLVQSPGDNTSVLVFQLVFTNPQDFTSPVRGLVSMAMNVGNIVRYVQGRTQTPNIDLCLSEPKQAPEHQRLYGPVACNDPYWINARPSLSHQIRFADRDWHILLRANDNYLQELDGWASGASLGAALCFSGLLSAFLLLLTGRTRRIEEQVTQRTTELASASAQLRDQKASLAQAQRIARMGSWEIGMGASNVNGSEEFRRLLDLPTSGRILLGDVLSRLAPEERLRLDEAIKAASLSPEQVSLDCCTLNREGEQKTLHIQIESEWSLGRLLRVHGTAQDVTDARQAQAHIQFLARFDSLTGLPNRSHWQELAHAALGAAKRHHDQAAVLFLDLDHFKTINDSLGHNVGDELLTGVAQRLKSSLRADDILARQGGDEFVIMLPRLHSFDEVGFVASKLVKCLSEPLQVGEHELSISVSIGIAHYPSDGEDIQTLLKHADVAMYSAKQSGRHNFQFFVPEMNERAMKRLELEHALRRGIDRGELILHFQPQLDLPSGKVNGCEALVRWLRPEHGMVPPMDFIPLAEESGLILPLGDWVLREACLQQVRWAAEGIHIMMAINISALQFQQADFIQKVADTIRETGANPRLIELEITESALLASTEQLIAQLESVRELGVSLALDDFGTGYSCLAYLKRLPIERLKIDRSFIKDLPGDAEDAAIALATISMARDLGMEVVAEGVENLAQSDYLSARNCRSIQGYFVCKPMPAETLTLWLREQLGLGEKPRGRS